MSRRHLQQPVIQNIPLRTDLGRKLRAALRDQQPIDTDPGRMICAHDPRHHYLGGGIRVCFECFVRVVMGKTPKP